MPACVGFVSADLPYSLLYRSTYKVFKNELRDKMLLETSIYFELLRLYKTSIEFAGLIVEGMD